MKKELQVFTIEDLFSSYPYRYLDKTGFKQIHDILPSNDWVQIKAELISLDTIAGKTRKSRISALIQDQTGIMELVWFKGGQWLMKKLEIGETYKIFGKVSIFNGKKTMAHPEIELVTNDFSASNTLEPVYPSTEKLENKGLGNKNRIRIMRNAISLLDQGNPLEENLPHYLLYTLNLPSRKDTIKWIHFPISLSQKNEAVRRIKFEEVFFMQLRMLYGKQRRKKKLKGIEIDSIGDHFLKFYNEILPFELTQAQKRVIKEIRKDLISGVHMNRLLQGDVGSGKTVVGFMIMLMAIDNGFQTCIMAPTQILAQQHFHSLVMWSRHLKINVELLTASTKSKEKLTILEKLSNGEIDILIGTHAIIQETVKFNNLALVIIDEQHRFGVAQRAKLWKKNEKFVPHILVMTATPIPRTLAMTVYGDLDVSIINELPPGRKSITTTHKREVHRATVIQFMHSQINKGRQIYVVFPLIEESSTLDLENLHDGYEQLLQYFPRPRFQIGIVHGRMKSKDKDNEMRKFAEGKTHILVSTTVIEVGVNVPNASVMIIENTERFGLSQLHQLRGRVGRGNAKSYCILMSSNKLSKLALQRINLMVSTQDGFKIAEEDLKMRGPGNIDGTIQSGISSLKLTNIIDDQNILIAARELVKKIISQDSKLEENRHQLMKNYLMKDPKFNNIWGRIS